MRLLRHHQQQRVVSAAAGKKGGGGGGKQPKQQQQAKAKKQQQAVNNKQQQQQPDDDDEEDDVIYLDDEDEEGAFDDEGEDEEGEDGGGWLDDDDAEFADLDGYDGAADDDEGLLNAGEDAVAPGALSTGAAPWGAAALAAAQQVLAGDGMADLRLFALRCFPSPARVDVRLDKLTDKYGSPELEDIESFSRRFNAALEAAIGEEAAGQIVMEVSSPGAERELALPGDLERFAALPLRVEFDGARAVVVEGGKKKGARGKKGGGAAEDGEGGGQLLDGAAAAASSSGGVGGAGGSSSNSLGSSGVAILELVRVDEEGNVSEWRLADVRANAPGKGRGLSRRQRDQQWLLPLDSLQRARVHVDF
jgi:ribosome maturation factor RimP